MSPKKSDPGREKAADKNNLNVLRIGAHQLRAPLSTISTQIKTILGGYVEGASPEIRRILENVDKKTREMLNMLNELFELAQLNESDKELAYETVDLESVFTKVREDIEAKAKLKGVLCDITAASLLPVVWARRGTVRHVIFTLLENGVKYTPAGGRVTAKLHYSDVKRRLEGTVSDSGIGIPHEAVGNLFEEFYRAPNAKQEVFEGTGLGLALVKKIIDLYKGKIEVQSEVGKGTSIKFSIPLIRATEEELAVTAAEKKRRRIVIIGGRAAGPKAAAKALRLDPEAEITVIEKERFLSYAGCGLPFYLSGQVKDTRVLMTTPDGDLRDPEFFRRVKGIAVYNRAECLSIDKTKKEISIKFHRSGETRSLGYDKLILATGGRPILPKLEGIGLKNVYTLNRIEDARGMRNVLRGLSGGDAVIIGGGLIGIESAEAIAQCGLRVTIIEARNQILSMLDPELSYFIARNLNKHGIRILTGERATKLVGDNGIVRKVITESRELDASLVIFGTGVAPETSLARDAGIQLGSTGGIVVNEWLQTSDPYIYAIGDCVENLDIITGKPVLLPLGSIANRQGRVAGTNVITHAETFPGLVETVVLKSFEYNIGSAGLNESDAVAAGFDPLSVIITGFDREHYYPSARQIVLKLVGDRATGRLLGLQGAGPGDVSKRIDVAAALLSTHETVDALSKLDLGYAPPYSTPMDIVCTAANVYKNKLYGTFKGISSIEMKRRLDAKDGMILVDVRNPEELQDGVISGATSIPLRSLRGRLHELPKDRDIVLYCSSGLNAYEASLILRSHGFTRVASLEGGIYAWPFEKEEVI